MNLLANQPVGLQVAGPELQRPELQPVAVVGAR